jgi:hypothetical protein
MTPEEHQTLANHVHDVLIKTHIVTECHLVKSHRGKPDHGDIDLKVLVTPNHNPSHTTAPEPAGAIARRHVAPILHQLGASMASLNHTTLSLLLPLPLPLPSPSPSPSPSNPEKDYGVQVDLEIHSDKREMMASLEYCHYSPLANIAGRLLKQAGIKWGMDGLSILVNPAQPELGYLHVSHDTEKVLNVLGVDPQIWNKGFNTQKDIFLYLHTSPLFNTTPFLPTNLNHENRKRDAKREEYHAWTTFCQSPANKTELTEEELTKEVEKAKKRLYDLFPLIKQQQEEYSRQAEMKFKAKVILKEINMHATTGLQGKELGELKTLLRKKIGGGEELKTSEWIIKTPTKEIITLIKSLAQSIKPPGL